MSGRAAGLVVAGNGGVFPPVWTDGGTDEGGRGRVCAPGVKVVLGGVPTETSGCVPRGDGPPSLKTVPQFFLRMALPGFVGWDFLAA